MPNIFIKKLCNAYQLLCSLHTLFHLILSVREVELQTQALYHGSVQMPNAPAFPGPWEAYKDSSTSFFLGSSESDLESMSFQIQLFINIDYLNYELINYKYTKQ
jgi:hypothetical protein